MVDARSGELLGLVTSNARYMGGTTLPRLNFCIAADELRGVVEWAQRAPGGLGGRAGEGAAGTVAADGTCGGVSRASLPGVGREKYAGPLDRATSAVCMRQQLRDMDQVDEVAGR